MPGRRPRPGRETPEEGAALSGEPPRSTSRAGRTTSATLSPGATGDGATNAGVPGAPPPTEADRARTKEPEPSTSPAASDPAADAAPSRAANPGTSRSDPSGRSMKTETAGGTEDSRGTTPVPGNDPAPSAATSTAAEEGTVSSTIGARPSPDGEKGKEATEGADLPSDTARKPGGRAGYHTPSQPSQPPSHNTAVGVETPGSSRDPAPHAAAPPPTHPPALEESTCSLKQTTPEQCCRAAQHCSRRFLPTLPTWRWWGRSVPGDRLLCTGNTA